MPYSSLARQAALDALQPLAQRFEAERINHHVPGLSIAVVLGQSVLWSAGMGLADREDQEPATAQTPFALGSISKLFTNTALFKLRDGGYFHLDTPLADFVPEITQVRTREVDPRPLTFRQLMAHIAGLPREALTAWQDGQFPTAVELLASLKDVELVFAPGSTWKYSNLGYAILGCALSRIVGDFSYYGSAIFKPLEMAHGSLFAPEERATGYMVADDGKVTRALLPHYNAFLPSFGLYASAADLARFLAFQFQRGPAGEKMPLGESTLREQHSPAFLDSTWSQGVAVGGWRLLPVAGRLVLEHGGAVHGFTSSLACVPSAELGVALLTNAFQVASGWRPSQLVEVVIEALLPVLAAYPLSGESDAAQGRDLARYEGRYSIPGLIALDVSLQEGRLLVSQAGGTATFELVPQQEEYTFLMRGGMLNGELARFVLSGERVISVQAGSFVLERAIDEP